MRVLGGYSAEIEESISPVVVVENLERSNLFEGYPKHCAGRTTIAAGGAGTNSQSIIQARSDRGIIYHVTGAWILVPAARVQIRIGNEALAANTPTTQVAYMDARDVGLPNALVTTNTPLTAAIQGTLFSQPDLTGGTLTVFYPLNVVLGELGFINIVNDTTNAAHQVFWEWTEYQLEDR